MARFLTTCLILIISSGCSKAYVCPTVEKAERIPLLPMSETAWESMNQEAQDTVTHNDLSLKEMIRLNEANIDAHNEVCGNNP